jgi:CelD/BcsL family acetyltransferase involved in cellulose biosynthesis/peptidoglycan/xylan/chitin deacetylase (PgdA/CDA1 family)
MKVIEIRKESELQGLQDAWNGLLARSRSETIFLTWEWVNTWWSVYGRSGELRVLLAVDGGGGIQGIAPLRRSAIRKYGRVYPALAFIGDGSADSDYLDFIAAPGEEAAVMAAFQRHLDSEFAAGAVVELNEIPDSSPVLEILREQGRKRGMVWAESESPCGSVSLPGDWESYLKMLAPRFRTKVRSLLRTLESRAGVRLYFCEEAAQVESLLPALFELHGKRWTREAKTGVFQWEEKRKFYRCLSALLLERGWLSFSVLEWNGRVLACQYGFTYKRRYFQLQEGYDPDCEHWNVGIGLRAWSIRQMIAQGVSGYDFLGGMGRHKSDWGAQTKLSRRVLMGRATASNVLLCRAPEWIIQARQSVKRRVPESWLAARDARQEQQRIARFERKQHDGAAERDWVRRGAAGLYYYSGLSLLSRPVRTRYQLQYSRKGAGLRIGLARRQHPTVRILYYHRINDDRDPFFPATPVAQLERELRIVSRQYRIVSLAEAVRRLTDGGPPGPVVVITFDDGYEDNYRVAYPILRKYGIPATIFLATGSIDSGEPLWFERLALALKKCKCASVELGLAVPRRFPLRNDAERLRANDEIYTFLRQLPDADRRRYLDEILHELDGLDASERNGKMLNWDQIRFLKANGIGFGGHTVTHPFVSKLELECASWEASECKRRIEAETQEAVEFFAYPSGREVDFSEWNKQVIQNAGYRAAVSTLWGVNDPATDRLQLRRGQPWELSPAAFAAKLDWYQWVEG